MRLGTKIAVALCAIAAAGSVTSGFVLSRSLRKSLEGAIRRENVTLASNTMVEIDRILYERSLDIQSLAEENALVELLQAKGEYQDLALLTRRYSRLTVLSGPWNSLSLVGRDATVVLSSSRSDVGRRLDDASHDYAALQEAFAGNTYNSDVVVADGTGAPTMIFAAPVKDLRDPREPVVGAIIGHFAWPFVLETLTKLPGTSRLYNRDGIVIGTNNPDDRALLLTQDDAGTATWTQSAADTELAGSLVLRGLGGEEVLNAHARETGFFDYGGNGWMLVSEIPVAEAFASAQRTALLVTLLLIALFLAVFSLVILLIRRIILNPISTLTEATQAISKGDLSKRISVGSDDEIGRLASAFNQMAADLERSYGVLETRVRERTNELQESVQELERLNKTMIGRELKMVELKRELDELRKRRAA